ncbi:hypothetical protein GCM10017688_07560 [Streptomyces ramulosus]
MVGFSGAALRKMHIKPAYTYRAPGKQREYDVYYEGQVRGRLAARPGSN